MSRPDGAPVDGTVVVTSAGGQAVVASDGSFELAVQLPDEADGLQVTAIAAGGTGSLVASLAVAGVVRGGLTRVPELQLQAADCAPAWLPAFGQKAGTPGSIFAVAVFDDGSGPALHAGGVFVAAGGVSAKNIAKWNGTSWSPLGSGTNGWVRAMTVLDDGSGPALYVGGSFSIAGGATAKGVARWDGASWSALGDGSAGPAFIQVQALAAFDDGGGPALYVGGSFWGIGGLTTANGIARWDGSTWSGLEWGFVGSGVVYSMAVFEDGTDAALYVGGSFAQTGGGLTVDNLARWNGSSWSTVGGGTDGTVRALAVFDDGTGPALFAAGYFTTAGAVPAARIAKWDGSAWHALGTGMDGGVSGLSALDDGTGIALYAGGDFTTADGVAANRIAKWDGSTWSALGAGVDDSVSTFTVFDDGTGPALFVGGPFKTVGGGIIANHIARWDGSGWSAFGEGLDDDVTSLLAFDDGNGPALYAAGDFTEAGGVAADSVAKWDGAAWSPLGTGITQNAVEALAAFDDGGGPALYAAGGFYTAGGVSANRIAKWDGTSWSPLGFGIDQNLGSRVRALAVFDDGGGPALFVGGNFASAGGAPASNIAKWDGSAWSPLGSGVSGGLSENVLALAIFDDGGGPALYAGGQFTVAGGLPASRIAKWDGSSWSSLGGGLPGNVRALAGFDDRGGPALFAGIDWTGSIAKWDGSTWTMDLGGGISGSVLTLAVHDEGSGRALYAAGNIVTAGGIPAERIAKWDGSSWSPLGDLLLGGGDTSIDALASFDEEAGSVLYAGGGFSTSGSLDSHIVKWGCSSPPVWADLGFALAGASGAPVLTGTGTLEPGTPGTLTLGNAAPSATAALFVALASTPTPFKGGTLVPVPVALTLPLVTSGSGDIPLTWASWPSGLPPGSSIYLQFAIVDAGAPAGVALSNASKATTP